MVIFHSYVSLPEGRSLQVLDGEVPMSDGEKSHKILL